jgi:SAM-dependent methyltransferase
VIRHLERVIASAPGKPERGSADHPMRKVTEQVVAAAAAWTSERATEVEAFFDELAGEWHTRSDPHRAEPVLDAYDRGEVPTTGVTLEVGSGTGLLTTMLAERCEIVIALDLSLEMLRYAPADMAPRVQGDASRFPFPDGAVTAAVFINAFLFPDEVARVLAPGGVVVWVNTSGDKTPIYLSADDVDAALPGEWTGVASEAGWGTWAVLRRP